VKVKVGMNDTERRRNMGIKFDYSCAGSFINCSEIESFSPYVSKAHEMLHGKTGPGSDFLGWVDLPVKYNREEFFRIKKAADKIRNDSDVLIVIGIGGSYLGSRAAIEALKHSFYNLLPKNKRNGPEIYFAGNNISSTYLTELLELIDGKDISVNVISKSGTTTEPAIAFRIFKEYMEKKYGVDKAGERIYATTDKAKGALKALADTNNYELFTIPDDVGGRFSVLTAVGLLPIAVAGIDADELLAGAADAFELYRKPFGDNPSYIYAACRNALYRKMKTIEIMVNYEPSLHFFTEWWKQLYGESEGKDGKGIFPAGVDFTTDLHSMGQYIQDGLRNIFETVLMVEKPRRDIIVEEDTNNLEHL
jgi:glucose-6-phosphate isomerase